MQLIINIMKIQLELKIGSISVILNHVSIACFLLQNLGSQYAEHKTYKFHKYVLYTRLALH